jgi:hypothetical protein
MTARHAAALDCDLCERSLTWDVSVTDTTMRAVAKLKGWRRDKIGRDVCGDHPRLNQRNRKKEK